MKSNRKGNVREGRKSFTLFCEVGGTGIQGEERDGGGWEGGKGREGRGKMKGKWNRRGRGRKGQGKGREME
jgi:hypothetical protein